MLRTWNKDRSDDRATRKTPQMRHGESKMTNGKWFPEDVVTMEYPPVLGSCDDPTPPYPKGPKALAGDWARTGSGTALVPAPRPAGHLIPARPFSPPSPRRRRKQKPKAKPRESHEDGRTSHPPRVSETQRKQSRMLPLPASSTLPNAVGYLGCAHTAARKPARLMAGPSSGLALPTAVGHLGCAHTAAR